MKTYAVVLGKWYKILDVLDPDDSCQIYHTARCGGCGECLLMQAHHYGCKIVYIELKNFKLLRWKILKKILTDKIKKI